MYFQLSKDGVVLENYNAPVEAAHPDSDGAAITRAREIGADRIVTSAGRVVVLPEVTTEVAPPAPSVIPPVVPAA